MYAYDEVDSLYVSQVRSAFVDEEYAYILSFPSQSQNLAQIKRPGYPWSFMHYAPKRSATMFQFTMRQKFSTYFARALR